MNGLVLENKMKSEMNIKNIILNGYEWKWM